MQRLRSFSTCSALTAFLVASLLLLSGCSGDTVTGPEQETNQEKVSKEDDSPSPSHNLRAIDDGSTADPDGQHNTSD